MKYFKFWVKDNFTIQIGEKSENISVLAGSNLSVEDASRQAQQQSREIESRIAKGESKDSYQVAIREHVKEEINNKNVVTVCRYGANVLNTTEYTILDLDSCVLGFWDRFRSISKLPPKEQIVAKFEQNIKKFPELGKDFRVYETMKGIRVIGKTYIDPSQTSYSNLMRKLGVDWLYIAISRKQQCYRARLTPKPYRIKHKTIKIKSPLDCMNNNYEAWAQSYVQASQRYSVVKLVKTLGTDFSNDKVVRYHDDVCNLTAKRTLA